MEGAYSYKWKEYHFAWHAIIWYLCQPCACKHIICLQVLQSLSISLQTYHILQTRCLRTYHMFASQLREPALAPMRKRTSATIQFAISSAGHLNQRNDAKAPLCCSDVGYRREVHITPPFTFPGCGVWQFLLVSVFPWSAPSITYQFSHQLWL